MIPVLEGGGGGGDTTHAQFLFISFLEKLEMQRLYAYLFKSQRANIPLTRKPMMQYDFLP